MDLKEIVNRYRALQLLVSRSPIKMAYVSPDMNYLAWSKEWAKYFPSDKLRYGANHYEAYPSIQTEKTIETGDDWIALHRKCIDEGERVVRKDSFINQDNSIVEFVYILTPVDWYDLDSKEKSAKNSMIMTVHDLEDIASLLVEANTI